MKAYRTSFFVALLSAVMSFGVLNAALAGTYLVCYLPADTEQRVIRFCPGSSDAAAGQACQCLLRTTSLAGTMTVVNIPDERSEAESQTMCVPHARTGATVTLCPAFRSSGGNECECGGGGPLGPGDEYAVRMMPRVPLRTNQAAAADFLKRLQECCVAH